VKFTDVTEELYRGGWFRFTEVAPVPQKILRKITPSIVFFIRHPIAEIRPWGWGLLKVLMRHATGKFFEEFYSLLGSETTTYVSCRHLVQERGEHWNQGSDVLVHS